MQRIKYNTQDVPKTQQLDYWNDAICDAFTHLKCEPVNGYSSAHTGFAGSIECCDMDNFQLSKVTSDASNVSRTKPHINQAASEVVLLHFQMVGSSKNSQGNNEVMLESGDFTLCKNSSPYSLEINNYHEMLVARIPVEKLMHYLNPEQIPTGFKFKRSDPFSKIVGDHLMQIWKARDQELSAYQISSLGDVSLSLLGTLVNSNAMPESLSKRQQGHLFVVKRYILDNLHRIELSIEEIAHNAGVTKRYIRQLFKLEGTSCSQFILSKRLQLTARRLKSSSCQHQKIVDLAFRSGFNTIEHFNRSFKKRYGITPVQYRRNSTVER